ncbi:PID-CTERM protein-sorting domain-containing protein [Changchengzhania lutea]|uniref:PID-CTERM protein-sorting domain-containing protein n=1 Tax=Changchengzhania lutea TaxID=2049305 RepID=UPI00115CD0FD|nr:hypothetical protein [Changchengzhania lutea]
MTGHNKIILASILFVLVSVVCSAQGDPVLPPPGPPPAPGFPIDGGAIAGVVVALFYGAKKLLKKH